jgi:hypothetical protein
MAIYRFFPLDSDGHVIAPAIEIDCLSDDTAVEAVSALPTRRSAGWDVWIGKRWVKTVMSVTR